MGRDRKFEPTGNPTADFVKAIRLMHNWSQEQLAKELEISHQSVQQWESGKTKPSGTARIIRSGFSLGIETPVQT